MNLPFHNAYVRDLAWVMASPSLLVESPDVVANAACQKYYESHYDWLCELDKDPALLMSTLQKHPSRRLGYYFEQLVAFWLQQRLAGDYFASHVRVFEGKRVLGEFDFLFTRRDSQQLLHWETAVKFYLHYTYANGEVLWYGPNARDRLDIKLKRVFTHQLRLGDSPQGKGLLQEKGFESVRSQTLFKGYLFYPVSSDWRYPAALPAIVAPDHLTGWWSTITNLILPDHTADHRWQILPRLEWLASRVITETQGRHLMDTSQLKDRLDRHFAHSQQSLLIAQLAKGANASWQEISRGFVVSAAWPNERP